MNILNNKNNYSQRLEYVKTEIERIRLQLNELINNKESNFLDPDVIRLSQLLDELINDYMQEFEK